MSTYVESVKSIKNFTSNVVIKINDVYFAIREPDSGLSIGTPFNKMVGSLVLNPTTIDIRRVSTTIASYSFKLIDKENVLTSLVNGDAADLIGQAVEIYLGRSGVGMDFADYYRLSTTYVQKCEHSENAYAFTSTEQTERMAKPIFAFTSALAGDIFAATTIWTMRDSLADWPSSGFIKIDNEFASYTGVDLVNNRLTGVVRGELTSVPVEHSANADVVFVQTVTDNPLSIILKLLISGGGGGTYDVFADGLGIDQTLIDITGIEALRTDLFNGVSYTLAIFDVSSALKFIEDELLMPCGLRLTTSQDSKVTLAILDKARFVEDIDVIDEDTITKYPKWSIDGAKVTNSLEIQWDYLEGTNTFQARSVFTDSASIALYGEQAPLKFSFKGIKASLDGSAIVTDFGDRLLARLSTPTPLIFITTQLDKSLQTIGDKAYLVSSKIPAVDGTLNFASDLEIISRAINQSTGDVTMTLAFTSYTSIRSGFIAPSDLITSFVSQSQVNIALGRGAQYQVGWYMRLYDVAARAYTADAPNKIIAIDSDSSSNLLTEAGERIISESGDGILMEQASTEDTIIFENAWGTTLTYPNNYRIRFCDYDTATDSQKRRAFISDDGLNFLIDDKPTYKVTY